MERKVELALAVERAARGARPARSSTSRTPSTRTAEGARRARELERVRRVLRADAVLRVRVRLRRGGRGPDDRPRRRRRRAARTTSTRRRSATRRPTARSRCTARASRRAAAARSCSIRTWRRASSSIIGGTLSADAVQRGRSLFAGKEGEQIADPQLRARRRRPRPRGPRDRAVRRRGSAAAAHGADRGRDAAHASCSTPTRRAWPGATSTGNGDPRLLPHAALGRRDQPAARRRRGERPTS